MPLPTFAPVDLAAWRARVERELGDKPFEKLVQKTLEGVVVEPLYAGPSPKIDPNVVAARATPGTWLVTSRVVAADPSRANALAREAVEDGADAVSFALDAAGRLGIDRQRDGAIELVGRDGVAVVTAGDVATLVSGIDLSRTKVFFEGGASAAPLAVLVEAALEATPRERLRTQVAVTSDPLGTLAREGELPRSLASLRAEEARADLVTLRPAVSTAVFHDAGASAVEELGLGVAAMAERGDVSFAEISASADVFLTIAKVRALRLLHRKLARALGRDEAPAPLFVSGRTSARRLTQRDPHANMIRVTTDAFGLAVGGVDALVTAAFDEALGESDPTARRLARHAQLVLREESHLARVLDPAGGSFYLDALTDELARKAWDVLRAIEAVGGLTKSLASGHAQGLIEASREARLSAIAKRRSIVVGVNEFALVGETKLARPPVRSALDREKAAERAERAAAIAVPTGSSGGERGTDELRALALAGASLSGIGARLADGREPERAVKLEPVRDAQRFEAVRDEADTLSSGGTRPEVVLACLGGPHEYRAREGFARRFFEAGGLVVRSIDSPDAVATKWIVTGPEVSTADVVCLCSSDERYASMGQAAIRTIRSAYPSTQIVLAGRATALASGATPTGDAPAEKVDLEIFLGVDALATLALVLQRVRQRRRRAAATTRRLA